MYIDTYIDMHIGTIPLSTYTRLCTYMYAFLIEHALYRMAVV
jgi:hypothetical protein